MLGPRGIVAKLLASRWLTWGELIPNTSPWSGLYLRHWLPKLRGGFWFKNFIFPSILTNWHEASIWKSLWHYYQRVDLEYTTGKEAQSFAGSFQILECSLQGVKPLEDFQSGFKKPSKRRRYDHASYGRHSTLQPMFCTSNAFGGGKWIGLSSCKL